jgi:hypothetical protein
VWGDLHPALKGDQRVKDVKEAIKKDEDFIDVMQSLRDCMTSDAIMVHLTGTVLSVIENHMRGYAAMLVAVSEGISKLADSVGERQKELAVADVKSAAVPPNRDESSLN